MRLQPTWLGQDNDWLANTIYFVAFQCGEDFALLLSALHEHIFSEEGLLVMRACERVALNHSNWRDEGIFTFWRLVLPCCVMVPPDAALHLTRCSCCSPVCPPASSESSVLMRMKLPACPYPLFSQMPATAVDGVQGSIVMEPN